MKNPFEFVKTSWQTVAGLYLNVSNVNNADLNLQTLEDRVLYDASPLGAFVQDFQDAQDVAHSAELTFGELEELMLTYEVPSATSDLSANDADNAGNRQEDVHLIVIDSRLEDYDQLLTDLEHLGDGFEVIQLDADTDGIEKITQYLNSGRQFGSLHIVGHGAEANVQLGSTQLNAGNIDDYEVQLSTWQSGLTSSADILLYGCNVAGGEDGIDFVDRFNEIVGADVAASDDLTGYALLGGDWEFEYTTGLIESEVVFSVDARENWHNTLQMVTVTTLDDVVDGDTSSLNNLTTNMGSDGAISLREAILAANSTTFADTIVLGSGVHSLSISGSGDASVGDLNINTDIEFVGAADGSTVIDASAISDRIFHVQSNNTIIRNLTIQGGSTLGMGGGILVAGGAATTELHNVVITGNTADLGGGVRSAGQLTVTNSTFSGNIATDSGGGVHLADNSGSFENVTFSNNSAATDGGAILVSNGTHDFTNVTVSGNSATNEGGAIKLNFGNVTLEQTTVTDNSANSGGGISRTDGNMNVNSSIVAGNSSTSNTEISGSINSGGNNIIGDHAGDSAGGSGYAGTDMLDEAGLDLGALADNGGLVQTHELLAGSPGVDAAGSAGAGETDGRGYYVNDPLRDIGAFERGATPSLEQNLVAHFQFEEGSGLTAVDSSSTGNDGTFNSNPTWTNDSAIGSQAIDFSVDAGPTNIFVDVPNNPAYNFGTNDFSVSFWYNMTTPSETVHLVGNSTGSTGDPGFRVAASPSGNMMFQRSNGAFAGNVEIPVPFDGQWHQFTVSVEGGEARLFSDGVEGSPWFGGGIATDVNTTSPLTIGAFDGVDDDFEGKLDDVRIYSRTLSATEASQLASGAQAAPDITSDLEHHYQFDNDTGTTLVDSSANNRDGSWTNQLPNDPQGAEGVAAEFAEASAGDPEAYAAVSSANTFDFGTGDFTISTWYKTDGVPAATGYLFDHESQTPSGDYAGVALIASPTGQLTATFEDDGGTFRSLTTGLNTTDTWTHVSIIRSGDDFSLVVDGTVVDSSTTSAIGSLSHPSSLYVGRSGESPSSGFEGQLDDMRIYSRALDSQDIQALVDLSSASQAPTDLIVTSGNEAGIELNINGGNDIYLVADNGGAVLGGQSSLTYEVQFSSNNMGAILPLLSYATTADDNEVQFSIDAGGQLSITIAGSTVFSNAINYQTLLNGDPQSLAFTWDNANGNWEVFSNGTLVDSKTLDGGTQSLALAQTIDTGGTIVFGQEQDWVEGGFSTADQFQGTFYNARFFSDVRSEAELAASYDREVPFNETDLVAQWEFDNVSSDGIVTESVSGNNLTLERISGFSYDNAELSMEIREDATSGTVVGEVMGVDPQREALIQSILTANPDLIYVPESNVFVEFNSTPVNWATAQANATSPANAINGVTGFLATITSASENEQVRAAAQAAGLNGVWLGASDSNTEGEWQWYHDGTAGEQFADGAGNSVGGLYTNFGALEPSGGASENHLEMDVNANQWNDLDGSALRGYIVEYNVDDVLDGVGGPSDQPLTYSIVGGNASAFAIDADSGEITVTDSAFLDHANQPVETLTIRVTDVDGNFYDKDFDVNILDLDEAPFETINNTIDITPNGQTPITSADLQFSDDNALPAEITFNVTLVASGSHVELSTNPGVVVTSFTQQDIDNGEVIYVHNGVGTADQVVFDVEDEDGNALANQVLLLSVFEDNDSPTFSTTLDGVAAYTEGGSNAVPLDIDAEIFDEELSSAGGGAGDFGGTVLTFERVGGGNADDNLTRVPGSNLMFVSGNFIELSGVQKGSYTWGGGTLVLTFDAGTTNADVNEIMQSIGYRNFTDNPPASVDIQWTFSDGNTGSQGTGGALEITGTTTVNITAVDDVATIDLDANDSSGSTGDDFNTTFTVGGSAVPVADVDAMIIDPDAFTHSTMTISIVGFNSSEDVLSADTSGTSLAFSFNTFNGVASISGSGTQAEFEQVLQTVSYENASSTPDMTDKKIRFHFGGDVAESTVVIGLAAPTDLSSGIELNTDGGNDAHFSAISAEPIFADATERTVEIRLQLDASAGSNPHLLTYWTSTELEEFEIALSPNDEITVTIGGATYTGNAHPELRDGGIHQVAVSWDNAAGEVNVYVDGALSSSGTVGQGYTLGSSGALDIGQGRSPGGYIPDEAFAGAFYDVRVWADVRSAGDIAENYQLKLDPTNLPPELVANFQFDGFVGNIVEDEVLSYNGLTIQHASGAGLVASTAVEDLHVDENSANGTSVGFVVPTDNNPESGDYSFSLTGANGRFAIDSNTGEITVADGSQLDYEVNPSHDVTVEVTDAAGNTYDEVMTIQVGNELELDVTQVVPGPQTIAEETILTFVAGTATEVSVGDSSSAIDSQMRVSLSVNDGVLNLFQTTNLVIVEGADGSGSIVIDGTEADINAALDGMTFEPDTNFDGIATLDMTTELSASSLGHYTFEGLNASNQAPGTGNDGVLVGGATIDSTSLVRGDVLAVNGAGEMLEIPGLFGEPAEVTLAGWVNLNSTGTWGSEVISLGNSVQLRVDGSGNGSEGVALAFWNGTNWLSVNSDVFIEGTGWHHVAASFDDVNNVQTVYLNGEVIATEAYTDSIVYGLGANTTIGAHGDGDGGWDFNGQIDEARVYDRVLSADEVMAIANDLPDVQSTSDNVTITVTGINDAPAFANLDDNPTFVEDGQSVVIDSDVTIFDAELSGADSFDGSSVYLGRNGGANGDDNFEPLSASLLGPLTEGGALVYNSTVVGTVNQNSGGELVLLFNSSATNSIVNSVMQSVAYSNSSDNPPTSVNLHWTFADNNNSGGQGTGGALWDSGSMIVDITATNDAPEVHWGSGITLGSVAEGDTNPAGTTVADLLASGTADPITDADNGAVEGIAIVAADNSNGNWQYSLNGASGPWNGFPATAVNNAMVLDPTAMIRFVPDPGYSGNNEAIAFFAWDQTDGRSSGDTGVNITAELGPASAFSSLAVTATIDVVPDANDAPVLDGTTNPHFATITEDDIGNAGETVSSLLATLGDPITDVDAGAVEGIAIIVNNENNGTWQYSTDGGANWTDVGVVSNSSALLLQDTDMLRMDPDGNRGASSNLGFRAWDQTSGTAGTKVDVTTTGGNSAFSNTTLSAQIEVTDVNDAPVLDNTGSTTMTTITEDDAANNGNSVLNLVLSSGLDLITDVDIDPEGFAIVGQGPAAGTWEYSTDSGSSWTNLGLVGDSNALLLGSTDRIRFIPDGENGAAPWLDVRAWDLSSGVAGDKVDATTTGGTTAFSDNVERVNQTVTAINDAPEITGASTAPPFINEIHYDNSGIDTGEAIEIAAPAGTDLTGWSLVRYNGVNGEVYGTDPLSGVVADQGAGMGTFVINYMPDGLQNGTSDGVALVDNLGNIVQFLSWEGTLTAVDGPAAGMTSTDIGVQQSGTGAAGNSIQLTDAGWVTDIANTFGNENTGQDFAGFAGSLPAQTIDEDNPLIFANALGNAITVGDVDAGASELAVTLQVSNGTLALGSIANVGNLTGNVSSTVSFTGTVAEINEALDGMIYNSSLNFNGSDQLTVTVNDQGNTGSGGAMNAAAVVDITVNPVNDAPDGTDNTIALDEDGVQTFAAGTFGLTDIDGDGFESVIISSVPTNGDLKLSGVNVIAGQELTLADMPNLLYVPNPNFAGGDSFTFQVRDDGGIANGGIDTDATPNTINVQVSPVNDSPMIANLDGDVVNYDAGDPFTLVDISSDALVTDVEGNFDGGTLSVSISAGQVLGEDIWGIRNEGNAAGQIGVSGTTLTYGTTVIGSISNGSTLVVTFNADADAAAVSATIQNVIYLNTDGVDPTAGNRVMDFVLLDGDGASSGLSQVTINVGGNDAPETNGGTSTLAEDTASQSFVISGTDANGTVESFRVISLPTDGNLYLDAAHTQEVMANTVYPATAGQVVLFYEADSDFNGTDTFEFAAIDNLGLEDSTSATHTFTVTPVNDTPTATAPATLDSTEQISLFLDGTGFTLGDIDAGASDIQVVFTATEGGVVTSIGDSGVVVSNVGGVTTITGTVAEISNLLAGSTTGFVAYQNLSHNPSPTATITMTVNDLGNSGSDPGLTGDGSSEIAQTTTMVNITAVNDAPDLTINGTTVFENSSNNTLTNAMISGVDVDDAPAGLTFTIASNVTEGTLTRITGGIPTILSVGDTFTQIDIENGLISYNHSGSEAATDRFDVRLADGGEDGAATRNGTFVFNINQVNDDPTTTPVVLSSIAEDSGVRVITEAELLANANDVDPGASLKAENLVVATGNGTLNDNGDGTWNYTPAANDDSNVSFNYTVTDGIANVAAVATLDITPVNDAPVVDLDDDDSVGVGVDFNAVFTEGDVSVLIADADAVLSDIDNTHLEGLVVTLAGTDTNPIHERISADYMSPGVNGGWNSTTKTFEFTGTATVEEYERMLQSISYLNFNEDPGSQNRILTISVNDGDNDSIVATSTISVVPINDNPILDLDEDDNTTTGVDFITAFMTGDSPVAIADVDANLDDYEGNISRLVIRIANPLDGTAESLTADLSGYPDFSQNYDSLTGELEITSTGTSVADYESILKSVVYNNSSTTLDAANREIDVTVYDDMLATAAAKTIINMSGDADAPTMVNNLGSSLVEGQTDFIESTELSFTDAIQPDPSITYNVTTGPANGFLALTSSPATPIASFTQAQIDNGEVTYVHNDSETVSDSFEFSVRDNVGNTLTGQIFNLTITAENDAPINSVPGLLATAEDTPLVFNTANGNLISISDIDDNGGELQVTLTANNGTISLNGDNGLTFGTGSGLLDANMSFTGTVTDINAALDGAVFIPNEDYVGSASVAILTNDQGNTGIGGSLSDSDLINISIAGSNDAPILDLDGDDSIAPGTSFSATITEGLTPVAIADSDATLTDVDDATLAGGVSVTIANRIDGINEVLSANTSGTPMTATYNPATGTLLIDGPGTIAQFEQVLQTVTYENLSESPSTTDRVINFVADDGTDTSLIATTTVTVVSVNDEQTVVNNFGITVNEASLNNPITTAALETVDPDNTSAELTYTLTSMPSDGDLHLNGTLLSLNGTFTQADIDNGNLTYSHDGTEANSDSFAFDVDDGQGVPSSGSLNITIAAANDAPELDNTGASSLTNIDEDDTASAGNTVASIISSAGGDRITDSDTNAVEGIAVTNVDNSNGQWQFSINNGANWTNLGNVSDVAAVTLDSTASIRFVPDANYNGPAGNIDFRAWDQTDGSVNGQTNVNSIPIDGTSAFSSDIEEASLTVVPENDNPVITSTNSFSIDENTTQVGLITTTDIDSGSPTFTLAGPDGGLFAIDSTGQISFISPSNFEFPMDSTGNNSYEVEIEVDDGDGGTTTQLVTINVGNVNERPEAITPTNGSIDDQTDTTGGQVITTLAASDPDSNDTFTYSIAGGPDASLFSIQGDQLVIDAGVIDFETKPQYTVVVEVTDQGGLTVEETITVDVVGYDAPPQLAASGPATVANEGQVTISPSDLSFTDTDTPAAQLVYTITSAPVDGELLFNGNPIANGDQFTQADIDAGLVVFAHTSGPASVDRFTFDVTDGPTTISNQEFDIVVGDATPIAENDGYTANEDESITGNVVANDTDAEPDPLAINLLSSPANASQFALQSDGSFSYTPNADYFGTDSFDYEVVDIAGNTSTASVTIQVLPVNDAPIGQQDEFVVNGGVSTAQILDVLANDLDVEDSAIIAVIDTPPQNGSLTLTADGTLAYLPNPGFIGTDTFIYIPTDAGSAGDPVVVQMTIVAVNQPVIDNNQPVEPTDPTDPTEPTEPTEEPIDSNTEEASNSETTMESSTGTEETTIVNQAVPRANSSNGADTLANSVPIIDLIDESISSSSEFEDIAGIVNEDMAAAVLHQIANNIDHANEANEEKIALLQLQAFASGAYNAEFLWQQIDDIENSFSTELGDISFSVGAISAFGAVGYVLWTLRGGVLVAAALSQIPNWKLIDPLPVLDSYNSGRDENFVDDVQGFFD